MIAWLVESVDVDRDVDQSKSERRGLGAVVGGFRPRSVVADWLGSADPRVGGTMNSSVSLSNGQ